MSKGEKKWNSSRFISVLLVIFVAIGSMVFLSSTSLAQQPDINKFYGLTGYAGNDTIYMNTEISGKDVPSGLCNPYLLPEVNVSAVQNHVYNNGNGTCRNAVVLEFGNELFDGSGPIYTQEFYLSCDHKLCVQFGLSIFTGSNQSYAVTRSDCHYHKCPTETVVHDSLSNYITGAGLAGGVSGLDMSNTYLDSVNITPNEPLCGSDSLACKGMVGLVSLIPYVDFATVPLCLLHDYTESSPVQSTSFNNINHAENVIEPLSTNAGNYIGCRPTPNSEYKCCYGQNVMGFSQAFQVSIGCSVFSQSGCLVLWANNTFGEITTTGIATGNPGANVSLSIPIEPAYLIGGQMTSSNGKSVSGQSMVINQEYCCLGVPSYNDYYVTTNSSGDYRFFAAPGYFYTIYPASDPNEAQCLQATATNSENGNLNVNFKLPSTFEAAFQESGLPSGTSWSVTLNGYTISSTSDTITFTEPSGTFSFSVPTISYQSGTLTIVYEPDPSSGKITGYQKEVLESITFTKHTFASPVR
jgi:hypothetical protein